MVDAGVIAANVAAVRAAMAGYPAACLLAVSKTFDAAAVRAAAAAGVRDFGENYWQEARAKQAALADLSDAGVVWHFVGGLQRRKARDVANAFDWVHSVDRVEVAESLATARGAVAGKPPLNVLIQVNVSGEASKSGVAMTAVPALAQAVAQLPNLRLRGLMAIPAATDDVGCQRRAFDAVAQLQAALVADGLALDSLSMGMSGDYEQALAAGATHIRLGTAIFGARAKNETV